MSITGIIACPNKLLRRDRKIDISTSDMLKASAGIKASSAGVLKTEKNRYDSSAVSPTWNTYTNHKGDKDDSQKVIVAGMRDASPSRNSISGSPKLPKLPNVAISTNAAA